jgi:hypothetical protein
MKNKKIETVDPNKFFTRHKSHGRDNDLWWPQLEKGGKK